MIPLPALAAAIGGLLFILLAAHGSTGPVEMVPGAVESQPFGCTSLELEPVEPACPGGHFHSGIDLAAPAGTPVLAPGGGVARVGAGGPCGIHVLIQHGGGIDTLFCHLLEATRPPAPAATTRSAAGVKIAARTAPIEGWRTSHP